MFFFTLIILGALFLHTPGHWRGSSQSLAVWTGSSNPGPATSIVSDNTGKPDVTYRQPPLVNRSILDKLKSLEQSFLDLQDQGPAATDRYSSWPPEIHHLPGEDIQGRRRPPEPKNRRDALLDLDFCKTSPCRLLLPSFIGEQESKARGHLLQLSHLARSLNRTLVLPNVGKSRMSTCSKWDFEFYYDTTDFSGSVPFRAFRKWVALKTRLPKAQVVEILLTSSSSGSDEGHTTIDSSDIPELEHAAVTISRLANPSKSTHNHCLQGRARNLYFDSFSPLHIHPHSDLRHVWEKNKADLVQFGRGVVEALSSSHIFQKAARIKGHDSTDEPDVLVVSWELRRPIFYSALPLDTLRYAERWTRVAEDLSSRLQPFVAIHWRMEGVPKFSLGACASLLVSTIASMLSRHDTAGQVASVYLATDYPAEGPGRPHSGTFQVDNEHHQAMRRFETAFNEDERVGVKTLTHLVRELQLGGLLREEFRMDDLDPGLMGIIDKMVAAKAALFISGGPKCGKVSSFTGQIIEERRRAKSLQNSPLLNSVEYFG